MTEIILKFMITVFCIWGIAEFLHILKQKIFAPEVDPETLLIVYLSGDTPDLQLVGVLNEYNWYRKFKPKKIIGIYSVIDEEALENCRKIANRHNICLISSNNSDSLNDFI